MKRAVIAVVVLAMGSLAEPASARRRRTRSEPKAEATPASAPQRPERDEVTSVAPKEAAQRESRIEFDERLIQGQTAAGAIYLFERAEPEFRSMIQPPKDFRSKVLRELLPDRGTP